MIRILNVPVPLYIRAWKPLTIDIQNYVISQEVGDGPNSILQYNIRAWRIQNIEWMKNIHVILHGIKWMVFHGLLDIIVLDP